MPIQLQTKPSRKQLNRGLVWFVAAAFALILSLTIGSGRLRADTGACSGALVTLPFNDVMSSAFFCQIAGAFFSGLTNGTSATTYSPTNTVTREQMAAFVTRTLDQSLRRGSQRAALRQWWTSSSPGTGVTTVGAGPFGVESDGADLWVANGGGGGTVSRVRASDGKLLETWTGATNATNVLVARGRIFVTGATTSEEPSGRLYVIDPTQPAGAVTTLANTLAGLPIGIAFDGTDIWMVNNPSSVSKVNPTTGATTNIFFGPPSVLNGGIVYDGANIWVTWGDLQSGGSIKKLNSSGTEIMSVPLPTYPRNPVFDGTNIWVPTWGTNSVAVVRASTGAVLANLGGNGLSQPHAAAFDGERILVTNSGANVVSLWKATDLSPLGSVSTSPEGAPSRACSDGLNFWVTISITDKLLRL